MAEELTKEKADDTGHTIRMMADLLNSLRKTKMISAFDRIASLSDSDHNELREAIRLIRGFVNNL